MAGCRISHKTSKTPLRIIGTQNTLVNSLISFISIAHVLAFSIFLVSCSRIPTSADEMARAALGECTSHPAGIIYSTEADEGSPDRLDRDMLAKLFGNGGELPAVLENINSAAVFLPTRGYPFEIAVIEMSSSSDTREVAVLCCERQDAIISLSESDKDKDGAAVWICGRYVISLLCPNAERVMRTVAGSTHAPLIKASGT